MRNYPERKSIRLDYLSSHFSIQGDTNTTTGFAENTQSDTTNLESSLLKTQLKKKTRAMSIMLKVPSYFRLFLIRLLVPDFSHFTRRKGILWPSSPGADHLIGRLFGFGVSLIDILMLKRGNSYK